ncbi:MAG: hypothetical protein ACOC0O_03140 [Spirochaetota bacterium]
MSAGELLEVAPEALRIVAANGCLDVVEIVIGFAEEPLDFADPNGVGVVDGAVGSTCRNPFRDMQRPSAIVRRDNELESPHLHGR